MQFSGNANELIAGYAADGYANLFNNFHFNTLTSVDTELTLSGVTAMKNHTLMHHTLGTETLS
ncbi:hypothetical protein D0868_08580 [Hortaea werneckii]|uniref:Uncharacterized protein n=1 Tax=Hortaea werneckii TaxID=91943 RepID=A0A3M6YE01_HORWE|nr:hypothetical protein D0868_08580 [Hortaea werneckii]